jgi:hypothetical protein
VVVGAVVAGTDVVVDGVGAAPAFLVCGTGGGDDCGTGAA